MRAKVPESKQAITRGISLLPPIDNYAAKRACGSFLSYSKYVALLIENDRDNDVLGEILTDRRKESAK